MGTVQDYGVVYSAWDQTRFLWGNLGNQDSYAWFTNDPPTSISPEMRWAFTHDSRRLMTYYRAYQSVTASTKGCLVANLSTSMVDFGTCALENPATNWIIETPGMPSALPSLAPSLLGPFLALGTPPAIPSLAPFSLLSHPGLALSPSWGPSCLPRFRQPLLPCPLDIALL